MRAWWFEERDGGGRSDVAVDDGEERVIRETVTMAFAFLQAASSSGAVNAATRLDLRR